MTFAKVECELPEIRLNTDVKSRLEFKLNEINLKPCYESAAVDLRLFSAKVYFASAVLKRVSTCAVQRRKGPALYMTIKTAYGSLHAMHDFQS